MKKQYRNSEYFISDPHDVTYFTFQRLSSTEERKLQAIIGVLAEYGWKYEEEVQDNGYPRVVSFIVKTRAGQEHKEFLDVRSSLLSYALGVLLARIDQAEHPEVNDGLKGLESLVRQPQREAELVAAYKAKRQR